MNQCPFCPFESKCETIINNHMYTHGENLSLFTELEDGKPTNCSCDNCRNEGMEFLLEFQQDLPNDNILLEREEQQLLPDEINEDTILVDPVRFEPNQKRWFKCGQCRYKSRLSENLRRHHILKHGDGTQIPWYYCDHCPYKSKQKSAMNVHVRHKHVPEEEIQWYHCDQCDYKTKTKSCLGYHKYQHATPESIKWYPCGRCDYKSKTRSRLNKHLSELHSDPGDIKWLKCEHCLMYITRRKSSLKLHIRRKHSEFLK